MPASDVENRAVELAGIDQRGEFGLGLADIPRWFTLEKLALALIGGVPIRELIRCHTN
ncbi:Uncharacterised protein [Mycobacteroides abscessus subsp. abscessus]|nr:Uncharacterised protein [Mycobacteroides abscessus subsp. abscessus]SIM86664.1 Uncharacterised protein [Mycobacteroides abscessus subsp. abscessus]